MERWSKERVWEWYNARPWIRGCNFMSSDCANRIDQWQEYGFEERLETTERELALAAETGFNSIRIIPEFLVWEKEHDGFMERFERYIQVAANNGISCMVVLGNDCMPPKEEALKRMHLGEQKVDWGYHGGRKISQHGTFNEPGYHLIDEPEYTEKHYEFVRELVTKYKDDERIIIWDVYNEPGNSNRKSLSLPHLKKFFEIIREIDPIQPLTVGVWSKAADIDNLPEIEKFGLDNSDIISYHSYGPYSLNVEIIHKLKKFDRPIVNTEWLARCLDNNVEEIFPLFFIEKVGCYNWGFVAGKYQTYEPWNSVWDKCYKDPNSVSWDFTKWFHDLYRPSLHPYNPKEIILMKKFCELADKEFI
ncbi:MAG: cellulase family glycosylhydrolase [Clostridia bacterium]|nr:cellulase family glycosylhydrolase [Clostridia bacterium]